MPQDMTGRIPVVVGVTGHRNIRKEDLPVLREAARTQLKKIKDMTPNSPHVLLTSLAEGPDQFTALEAQELGYSIYAALPMDPADYGEDFAGDAFQSFKSLIMRADRVFVCPETEKHEDGRDFLYRQAGIYVARHCHVLLSFWDGEDAEDEGCGTAAVHWIKTSGWNRSGDEAQMEPYSGMSVQIMTPKAGREYRGGLAAGQVSVHGDDDVVREALRRTELFNMEAAVIPVKATGDAVSESYAAADALSVRHYSRYRRSLAMLAVFGALLTTAFLLYDEVNMHYMIVLCGLMLLAMYAVRRISVRLGSRTGYVEYRVLAESLRVQDSLNRSGVRLFAADEMPWNIKHNLPWVEYAVAALTAGASPARETGYPGLWVDDQYRYHVSARRKDENRLKKNNRVVSTAYIITIISYLAAFFFEAAVSGIFFEPGGWLLENAEVIRTAVKVVLGIMASNTVFVSNYYGKLALEERIEDHDKMISLFGRASGIMETGGGVSELILRELAREELSENSGWYSYQSRNEEEISV